MTLYASVMFALGENKMSDNQSITADANLMHHLLLWIYNWTKEDFELAFKYSHLGWRYQWDKFQGRINEDGYSDDTLPLIPTIPCQFSF